MARKKKEVIEEQEVKTEAVKAKTRENLNVNLKK